MEDLRDLFVKEGFAKFSADQAYQWLHQHGNYDVDSWSNVSNKAKEFIKENLSFSLPRVVWNGLSKDGTRKFLLAMEDKQTIEAVLIPAPRRKTICISSQVGCAIGCTFCHTGTMGLKRHLKAHEITGQFIALTNWLKEHAPEEGKITNIVYMGQGEPLHNFDAVKKATEVFSRTKKA